MIEWLPEFVARAVAAILLFAAAGLAGWCLAAVLTSSRYFLLRIATTIVCASWILTVIFAGLLPLGRFHLLEGLVSVTLTAACLSRLPRLADDARRFGRAIGRIVRLLHRTPRSAWIAFFAFCAVTVLIRALIMPPLGWDTLTYHGLRAALWVQTGQPTFDSAPGAWEIYRHYFSGSEVLFAWALLPLHSDVLTGFVQGLQWLGIFIAVFAFARAVGIREPWGSSAAAAVLFVPTLSRSVGSGYVELYQMLCLVTGMAATVLFFRYRAVPLMLLAASAWGLAIGTKVTTLPALGGAILLALIGLARTEGTIVRRAGWLAVALLCLVLPSMPWLTLSLRETGFPLSPLDISIAGIRLGATNSAMMWYQTRPSIVPGLPTELTALAKVFGASSGVDESFGVVTLLPFLLFPVGFVAFARKRPLIAAAIAVSILGVLAFYYSQSFAAVRILWAASSSRFLLPVLVFVVPVSLAWATADSRGARAYLTGLLVISGYSALRHLGVGWPILQGLPVLTLFLVAVAGVATVYTRLGLRPAATVVLFLAVVGLTGLQAFAWTVRASAARTAFQIHPYPKFWAPAAELVDEPTNRHVIAVTAGPWQNADNWPAYYLLGRQYQNTVTYVSPWKDGLVHSFRPDGGVDSEADKKAWIERLKGRGVTEVMSFPPDAVELAWMEQTPDQFELLTRGGNWGFYRVRR